MQIMDQQLYAIAEEVASGHPEEFANHFLRLRAFHTECCFIVVIWILWGYGGLPDLLAESGVYAPGTVDHLLNGKQYNHGVHALTLTYAHWNIFMVNKRDLFKKTKKKQH